MDDKIQKQYIDMLYTENGFIYCPVDECNWSVAKGMEKLFIQHIKEHPEKFDSVE